MEFKLVITNKLINAEKTELIAFPQVYRKVVLSETGVAYCYNGQLLTRYHLTKNNDPFEAP